MGFNNKPRTLKQSNEFLRLLKILINKIPTFNGIQREIILVNKNPNMNGI